MTSPLRSDLRERLKDLINRWNSRAAAMTIGRYTTAEEQAQADTYGICADEIESLLVSVPVEQEPKEKELEGLLNHFLNLCTERQKLCPHKYANRVERCIRCVIDEGVSVLAVNRMLVAGEALTDAHVDAYFDTLPEALSPLSPAQEGSK